MSVIERVTTHEQVVYIIDKQNELGKGAFGTVYGCQREGSTKKLVAKFIKCRKSSAHKRIVSEIELHRLACKQNEYVVKLVDYTTRQTPSPYVKYDPGDFRPMEFILIVEKMDMDLRQFLEKKPRKRLSEKEAQFYFIQLVEGLRGFSRDEIIHRDLKLENIMLRNKRIKFVDFGLSTQQAVSTSIVGTPFNMPPWMLRRSKKHYDNTVDLYALGLILFELVTGFHVYDRDFEGSTSKQVLASLARVKEQNQGETLFADAEFFRSRGFDPQKRLSKPLRDLLKYMIRTETEQNERYNVFDLMQQAWLEDAHSRYNKYYQSKLLGNGKAQLELVESQLGNSIFQSRVMRKPIANPVRAEMFETLEQYHIELQKVSAQTVEFLAQCHEQAAECVRLVARRRPGRGLGSKSGAFRMTDLLTKLDIFFLGNLIWQAKDYFKHAFTSQGFVDYLRLIHGKKLYRLDLIRRFFREVVNQKEEILQQKHLTEANCRDFHRRFDRARSSFETANLTVGFTKKVVQPIDQNDWPRFQTAESAVLQPLLRKLKLANDALYAELLQSGQLSEDREFSLELADDAPDGEVLCQLNKAVYALAYKMERFQLAKLEQDFEGLLILEQEINTNSHTYFKLELEQTAGSSLAINDRPVLPFLYVMGLVILALCFVVYLVKD